MPRPKRPRDMNQLAASIVAEATSEEPPVEEPDRRSPHAVALGKLGASKGGHARAAALSPKKRQAIARKAIKTRWAKQRAAQRQARRQTQATS